jgi:hypothetical protein
MADAEEGSEKKGSEKEPEKKPTAKKPPSDSSRELSRGSNEEKRE